MSSKNGFRQTGKWSLATWLTVCYSTLSIVIVASVTAYSYWLLVLNLRQEDDQFVLAYLRDVESRLLDDPREIDELRSLWGMTDVPSSHVRILMRILQPDGTVLVVTPRSHEVQWPAISADSSRDQPPPLNALVTSGNWRCFQKKAALSTGEPVILQASLDDRQEKAVLGRYRRQLYLVVLAAAIVSAGGGLILARRGLRPLREFSVIAAGIQASQMTQRLDSSEYSTELEDVATTFNRMLDRLQDSFERLNRFSGDIAHELRTPLHNLRGEVEVALTKTRSVAEHRDVLGSCLEETIRLSRLVDSLLFLAKTEQPESALVRDSLRLADELRTIQEFYEAAADEVGVALPVTCTTNAEFYVDRVLFQRAIGNLITNAIAHTPKGGQVRVEGAIHSSGVKVTVSDTGSGIDSEQLPYVFDRLFRGTGPKTDTIGHGLGLSIVKMIVELHGGSISIESPPNEGTRVDTNWPSRNV